MGTPSSAAGSFNKRIMDYLADEFRKDQGIDLRNDRLRQCQRLARQVQKAKLRIPRRWKPASTSPFHHGRPAQPQDTSINELERLYLVLKCIFILTHQRGPPSLSIALQSISENKGK